MSPVITLLPLTPAQRDAIEEAEAKKKAEKDSFLRSTVSGPAAAAKSALGGFDAGVGGALTSFGNLAEKAGTPSTPTPIQQGIQTVSGARFGMSPERSAEVSAQGSAMWKGMGEGLRNVGESVTKTGEAVKAEGLPGLPGKILSGIGGALAALPRIAAFGPGGLIVDSAVMAFANANPGSEVELWPGGPVVRGEVAPTVVGAIQGALMHGIFKGGGMLPKGLARPVTGAAMGAATLGSGGSVEEAVESGVVGAALAGKGREIRMKEIARDIAKAYGAKPGTEVVESPEQPALPGPDFERLAAEVKTEKEYADRVTKSAGKEPLPERDVQEVFGGPKTTGQQELPGMPKDIGSPSLVTGGRPIEEEPIIRPKNSRDMPDFVENLLHLTEGPEALTFVDTVSGYKKYVQENTPGGMHALGTTPREAGADLMARFYALRDANGNPTDHLATNFRTFLRNVIAEGEKATDEATGRYVETAKILVELPESSREFRVAPQVGEQRGTPSVAGFSQIGTGLMVIDPPGYSATSPQKVIETGLHEGTHNILGQFMNRMSDAHGKPMSEKFEDIRHKIEVWKKEAMAIARTDEERAHVRFLAYGASNKAEAAAEALTGTNLLELMKMVMPSEEAEFRLQKMRAVVIKDLSTPRAGLADQPVSVKMTTNGWPGEKKGTYKFNIDIPSWDSFRIGTIEGRLQDLGGIQKMVEKELGRTTLFAATPGMETVEVAKQLLELGDRLRKEGVTVEADPMAFIKEQKRQLSLDLEGAVPSMETSDPRVPSAGGQGGKAAERPRGERNWPSREEAALEDDIQGIRAEKGKDGKYKQEKLPPADSYETYLAIKTKDGAVFTSYATKEAYAHSDLAERLGLSPYDIKDAGYWSMGEWEPAPDTNIWQWVDSQKAVVKKPAGVGVSGWDYFARDLGGEAGGPAGERTYWKKRTGAPEDTAVELKGLSKNSKAWYDKKIDEIETRQAIQESNDELEGWRQEGDWKNQSLDPGNLDETKLVSDIQSIKSAPQVRPSVLAKFQTKFKKAEEIVKAVGGPRFKAKLSFDPEKVQPLDLKDPMVFDEIGKAKQSPEYSGLFDAVYKDAKEIPWNKGFEMKKAEQTRKLADMMVIKLTKNCQRANALSFYKEFGLVPSDWAIEPCYGSACWADRKSAGTTHLRISGYESISERDFEAMTPAGIEQMWKSKAFLRDAEKSPFLRHGQVGDDSHSIKLGLVEKFLSEQKKAGNTSQNVFISAGYAATTPEDYAKLAPYRDQFTIHFSVSGWDGFPKGDTLNRINEFKMARAAGLDAVFRVITNKDGLTNAMSKNATGVDAGKVVGMKNQQWLLDAMKESMGIEGKDSQFYILETPYHNDFLPKEVARSKKGLQWAKECCKPTEGGIQCKTCSILCMTQIGRQWRTQRLALTNGGKGDINAILKPGATHEELLDARGKQIEEFIRRTGLPEDKAAEVRGLCDQPGMEKSGPYEEGRPRPRVRTKDAPRAVRPRNKVPETRGPRSRGARREPVGAHRQEVRRCHRHRERTRRQRRFLQGHSGRGQLGRRCYQGTSDPPGLPRERVCLHAHTRGGSVRLDARGPEQDTRGGRHRDAHALRRAHRRGEEQSAEGPPV
jgi:hypothetical protein